MAINHQNKESIMEQVLPAIHFNVSNTGVTITSNRLKNARFIPFDFPGLCRACTSEELKIDHCITIEGIHLYSNRFKGTKFVGFDLIYEYPPCCFFTVKCKGRVFKIPHKGERKEPVKKEPAEKDAAEQIKSKIEEKEIMDQDAMPKPEAIVEKEKDQQPTEM
jgi:hypothetical protein